MLGCAMPSAGEVDIFLASLKRCLARPDFLLNFYGIFMASSDEIREKFKNTDFKHQTRVLAESLWTMAVVAQTEEGSPGWGDLPRLAERHSQRDLGIRPELYDGWLESLLEAARRHDAQFSPEIEEAWRRTLAVGIDFMRGRY
jgi:hemoglobin-like flavoprotein